MSISLSTNLFSSGQQLPTDVLSVKDCFEIKDFLTAYKIITDNPFANKDYETQLLKILTENDLIHDIYTIYTTLNEPFDQSFFQKIAKSYGKLNNRQRVLEIFNKLPYGVAKEETGKIFYKISSNPNKKEALLIILKSYETVDNLDEGVKIVKDLCGSINYEDILMEFGNDLIYEQRWGICNELEEHLNKHKSKFIEQVNQAREISNTLNRTSPARRILFRA